MFVGIGAAYAFTGWNRATALWLLATGLILAVVALLMDRRRRY